jgi:hypothetical protein
VSEAANVRSELGTRAIHGIVTVTVRSNLYIFSYVRRTADARKRRWAGTGVQDSAPDGPAHSEQSLRISKHAASRSSGGSDPGPDGRAIINYFVSSQRHGRKLVVAGVNGRVLELFRMTKVEGLLTMKATVAEAELAV